MFSQNDDFIWNTVYVCHFANFNVFLQPYPKIQIILCIRLRFLDVFTHSSTIWRNCFDKPLIYFELRFLVYAIRTVFQAYRLNNKWLKTQDFIFNKYTTLLISVNPCANYVLWLLIVKFSKLPFIFIFLYVSLNHESRIVWIFLPSAIIQIEPSIQLSNIRVLDMSP
jgi:hypothetical protein